MGEVVIAGHTVTGEGTVLAQRLEQLAAPGGVCIQGATYDAVPKRLPFTYQDLGVCKLKGYDEPILAYSVHTQNEVVTMPPQTSAAPVRPSLPANYRSSYFPSPIGAAMSNRSTSVTA
jgi:class 3 adenylate cyclase